MIQQLPKKKLEFFWPSLVVGKQLQIAIGKLRTWGWGDGPHYAYINLMLLFILWILDTEKDFTKLILK